MVLLVPQAVTRSVSKAISAHLVRASGFHKTQRASSVPIPTVVSGYKMQVARSSSNYNIKAAKGIL
jgi:hypothetical protein